ncbi:MAG: cytochrome b/b6 domain-containing protein [Pseudomonadota bacterium]
MSQLTAWDPFVRVFHWSLATLFLINSFILDEDGDLHAYVGYALFALVILRIIWGYTGPRKARFKTFLPSIDQLKAHLGEWMNRPSGPVKSHESHNPLGALMVFNLLASILLLSITGLMMRDAAFGSAGTVADLHEFLANYTLACVGLHVVGVLFEIWRSGLGVIRAMTHGRQT